MILFKTLCSKEYENQFTTKFNQLTSNDGKGGYDKCIYLNERVGFDHVVFHAKIILFDESLFEKARYLYDVEANSNIEIKAQETANREKAVLRGLFTKKYYKKIEIQFSQKEKVEIAIKEIPKLGSMDIVSIKIGVRSTASAPELSNIQNYSCDELKSVVDVIKNNLKNMGIVIGEIKFYKVEINRTFTIHDDFSKLASKLFFLSYQKKMNITSRVASELNKKTMENQYYNVCFENKSKKFRLKIYDKAYELTNNNIHHNKLTFRNNKSVVRVEFTLLDSTKIAKWFKNKSLTYLDNMTQDKLEEIFCSMIQKYLIDAYDNYAMYTQRELINKIKMVDTKPGGIDSFCNNILNTNGGYKNPLVISNTDLDFYICENEKMRKKEKYYKKRISEELRKRDSSLSDDAYAILYIFFKKAMGQYISKSEMIAYNVERKF